LKLPGNNDAFWWISCFLIISLTTAFLVWRTVTIAKLHNIPIWKALALFG
jgi:hypothetical protein